MKTLAQIFLSFTLLFVSGKSALFGQNNELSSFMIRNDSIVFSRKDSVVALDSAKHYDLFKVNKLLKNEIKQKSNDLFYEAFSKTYFVQKDTLKELFLITFYSNLYIRGTVRKFSIEAEFDLKKDKITKKFVLKSNSIKNFKFTQLIEESKEFISNSTLYYAGIDPDLSSKLDITPYLIHIDILNMHI